MISIIIPTLNEENNVGELLDDLARQTRRDFEVIVVDGDSEDGTCNVVLSREGTVPGLRLIRSEVRGLALQRNLGGRSAGADRLFFMDADGRVDEDFLEKTTREIRARTIECGTALSTPMSNRIFDRVYFKFYLDIVIRATQYFSPIVTGACLICTRRVFDKIGGFDEKILFEDSNFAKRARRAGRYGVLTSARVRTSVRRLDADGRWAVAGRLFIVFFRRLLFGEIPRNDDLYRFGHYGSDITDV